MDLFGVKRRKKQKEIEDALRWNMLVFAWISEKLTRAELKDDKSEIAELHKGYCRTLEVIENQRKFLYGERELYRER